jgi:tetratricopeptide (TPR) repeat protein
VTLAPHPLVLTARTAIGAGQWLEAARIAAQLAAQAPDRVEAIEIRYLVARQAEDLIEAEALLRKAIETAPGQRWPHGDLTRLLLDQGRTSEAQAAAVTALRNDPANPDALAMLAGMALDQGLAIEAEDHALAAIGLAGRHPQLLLLLGKALLFQGQIAQARQALTEAVSHQPSLEALAALADLEERASDYSAATRCLDRADQAARQRGSNVDLQRTILLARQGRQAEALALLDGRTDLSGAALLQRGRLRDKAGRHDEAWSDWTSGKARIAAQTGRGYDADELEREAAALTAFAERCDPCPGLVRAEPKGRQPVFILGFPRSGTTLVEQIVAAHSQVLAGGELPFGRELRELAVARAGGEIAYLDWLVSGEPPAPDLVAGLRAHYLARAERYRLMAPDGAYFTDKMPLNELWLPLIRLCFPEARVVRVVRHPLDVLVSVLSHDMTHGSNCGYRIGDAARHMRLIHRQIAAYSRAGLRIDLHLRYEDLVADQSGETARLMDCLGLAVEPRQIAFHREARIAPTPSYAQVQEPLNARSIDRWRHYAAELEPAIALLGEVLEELGYSMD